MPDTTASALAPCPVPLVLTRNRTHPERAARRGELVPIRRGVYAPASVWNRLPPWDRYVARVHAVGVTRPGCVFSHESAAALLGLPVVGAPRDVHVLADAGVSGGDRGGLRVHTTRDPREIVEVGGVSLTSATECAIDIARDRCELIALSVADAVLRAGHVRSTDVLVARNEDRSTSRGRRRARWSLHRADAAAESTLESLSRGTIDLLGYVEPELQPVLGRDRVDFRWGDDDVLGEADGDLKFDGRFGDAPLLLREQRARDARLRAGGARRIMHWGWQDVVEFDRLDDILRSAGVRRLRPPDLERLTRCRVALRPAPALDPRDVSPAPRARREPSVSGRN
ncbi:hypothetical protein [Microbacterium sp. cf332]|uniref:hypothetical protein n=1 Tax=Microbacterium sp. cf332 TaxID=1761804 RepID=UPI00087F8935|nr:hypothetical protein [Microbacterium sp. cf332]SDQ06430.1 Transcriptional regulator, AbiEi antitoxin, Type IV TA system [Microbacterium sp. cf332]